MPKVTSITEVKVETVEDKLDHMIAILQRMDKRDRIRTWGSMFHTLFAIIPLLIFLGSLWYIAVNGPALMKQIADVAASAAADYTQNQSKSLYDEIMNKYKTPGTK